MLDYLCWLKTGELHYLSLEERSLLKGEWDENSWCVLANQSILDICFSVIPNPNDAFKLAH